MSHDTMVTLQGYVGSDVHLRRAGDTPVANIRVACTPRRYRRRTDSWVDGPTQWYTVNAWRALGEHCARSLHSGDPVIVHGRLNVSSYVNRSDVEVTVLEVDAILVGHDLNRGVTQFSKVPREQPAEGDGSSAEGDGSSAEPAA